MTFKEKLVILRKSKGLTQDDFASAVGVSRQAVYKWESGQSYPEVPKLLEMKMLFTISIDELLDDNYDLPLPEKKKKKRVPKTDSAAPKAAPAPKADPAPKAEPVAKVEPAEPQAEPIVKTAPTAPVAPKAEPAVKVAPVAAPKAEQPAANRMRSVPHSRSAISMVSGMPSPMPCGLLYTNLTRKRARRRGLISLMGMALPCEQATAFSEMKRMSPSCR